MKYDRFFPKCCLMLILIDEWFLLGELESFPQENILWKWTQFRLYKKVSCFLGIRKRVLLSEDKGLIVSIAATAGSYWRSGAVRRAMGTASTLWFFGDGSSKTQLEDSGTNGFVSEIYHYVCLSFDYMVCEEVISHLGFPSPQIVLIL